MLLGVDVGGTFTDAVVVAGDRVYTAKSPTTPNDQSIGVMEAIDTVLASASAEPGDISHFAHGMTVGTNALLERSGARTTLIATAGFTDLIEIARQNRPALYRLCEDRPAPLAQPGMRIAVRERIGPDGVVEPLGTEEIDRVVAEVGRLDPESVAICLLFSFRDPSHEEMLATALRDRYPGLHVSVSSEVLPRFREYERCSTTILDAYLSPMLAGYLGRLQGSCRRAAIPEPLIMQSSGGVVSSAEAGAGAAWSVLSGPAGGAVGAGLLAVASGNGNALGLDMGGTSCDVCVVEDGRVGQTDAREFDRRPIQLPMVDVHTVGAGGGSIAWRDGGGALRVGPESAGAEPGPACYGRGGVRPTVTDANLVLGYLDPVAGLAGGVALDRDAAEVAIGELAAEIGLEPIEAAFGIVEVANQEMLRALRVITVERGIDPRDFALLPFGGAGPLHAAAVACELGIDRILCPRSGGVLSALGLVSSERRRDTTRTVMLSGQELTAKRIASEVFALSKLLDPGADATLEALYELRYHGQSFELPIDGSLSPDPDQLGEAFAEEHQRRYGYREVGGRLELVNIRLSAREPVADVVVPVGTSVEPKVSRRPARFAEGWSEVAVIGGEPPAGFEVEGPCVFELPETTMLLPRGWTATVDPHGTIVASTDGSAER